MLVKYYGLFHQMAEGMDGNSSFYFRILFLSFSSLTIDVGVYQFSSWWMIPYVSLRGPNARFWYHASITDKLNCHNGGHWHIEAGTNWSPVCGWYDEMRLCAFWLTIHWSLFLMAQATMNQHFCRTWFGVKHSTIISNAKNVSMLWRHHMRGNIVCYQ